MPPLEYLTRWWMLLAGDRLANSGDSVSSVVLSLGYKSESVFSTAFKRVIGCSPRQHSRGQSKVSAKYSLMEKPNQTAAATNGMATQRLKHRHNKALHPTAYSLRFGRKLPSLRLPAAGELGR
jgi:AraC-like DNA-binding protein